MGRSVLVWIGICLWIVTAAGHPAVREKSPQSGTVDPSLDRSRVQNVLAQTPLSFEENRGQAPPDVLYVARSAIYGVSLHRDRITLTLPDRTRPARPDRPTTDISIRLAGSRTPAGIDGLDPQQARSFYYKGQDPSRWITDVPHVARVRYASVYPGIDAVFYGSQRRLEFDFVVAPQADVKDIGLDLDGVEAMRIDPAGDLILQVAGGELVQRKPVAYQESDEARLEVEARYVLDGSRVRLDVGHYDHTRPLVIDPVFDNSTFIGGSGSDNVLAMAVDAFGQLHVTGYTQSPDFPTSAGGSIGPRGNTDVFLMVFSTTNDLLTSTVIGSPVADEVYAIAVDPSGASYLVGTTYGSGYPTTPGAFDETWNGGPDVFATKVALNGQIVYSTYIGAGGEDHGRGAALVAGTNELLIVGDTNSTDFPRTMGPTHQGFFDVFLVKLNAVGSSSGFVSRLIGGSSNDDVEGLAVRTAAFGSKIVIAGETRSTNFPTAADSFDTSFNGTEDVFVCEFSPSFTLLVTTFLGGSGEDKSRGVAVLDNETFVTGYTLSDNFPGGGTRQGQDAFAARFGPNLNTLVYSRIFQGSGTDVGYEIVAGHDPNGFNYNAYILGDTTSADFFITFNGLDPFYGATNDAFLIKLNGAGQTMYSSYLGGTGGDFGRALALQGTTLWAGGTTSGGLPIVGSPFDGTYNGNGDGFVARFSNFDDTNVTQQLLTLNRQGNGTVTSVPPGIDCGADCLQAYPNNRVVTLNAAPATVVWTGCDRTSGASCVVTMNAPKTITAAFSAQPVPSITSMTPSAGTTSGGTAVTIVGQNFTGASVTIGGAAVRNLVVQPAKLTFLTPAHAAGGVPVVVNTGFGSASRTFTYVAPQIQTLTNAARPSFSFDGRWMAFESTAALVDNDTNGLPDVFVRDRRNGKIVRVSVSSTGAQAIGGGSRRPSISATGRFVAFESAATNLVPADTNQAIDIFVVDRDPDNNGVFDETTAGRTSRTFRVNLGPPTGAEPGGAQALGGDSQAPSISGSGRWIAFESAATNLVPSDTNQRRDIFVFDTALGRTVRASVSTSGEQAVNGDSTAAAISLDGHAVAFQSGATNLVPGDTNNNIDVFVRDRDVDHDALFDEPGAVATIRVSVATSGIQAEGGPSTDPSITGDGMLIAFVSAANNLVPGDSNGAPDVFLRDRNLGTTRRMSLDPATGRQFVGAAYAPAISANGNTLIFSLASTLTLSFSAPGGVIFAAPDQGTNTGGTVTIPGPNQGNGPPEGTVDQAQNGETRGEPGVSGDGSTTGSTSEQPGGGSDIDVVDNESEESAGGNDPPYIAEISPPVGPPGGGGTAEIVGDNFDNGAVVRWGTFDVPATVVDTAHATVQVPPGNGQVAVAVRSGGELSNDLPFTYSAGLSTPQITAVNPLSGSTEGGTLVAINGTGFVPANIAVRFRGRDAAVQPGATATALVVQTPPHVEGPAPIVVINEDGGQATFGQPFTYVAPLPITPVITELLPSQGFREQTTVITVHGQARSFAPGTTATVDGLAAPVSYFNDKTIVVEAPPTPTAGNVPLVVTVPGGGSATANFLHFSVPNPFTGTSDTDGDGMTDAFEQAFGLNPNDPSDAAGDPDGDGLSNLQEATTKHHPVGLYTRYLAEGAANEFFETRISIANPNTSPATILVHFQRDVVPASEVTYFAVVPPMSRIHLDPAQTPINLPAGSFATVVESNVEVAVDRTMFWDHSRYGSSAETSVASPATTWYLAEGATNSLFELFYLLQNPDLTRTADVRIRYIRGIGDPIELVYHVPPQSRQTIRVNGEDPGLAFADISAVVTSENGVPIIVERAMYARFPGQRAFEAGHDSAGVTALSTDWFLAEGATGPFFEMFILYANPNATDANVETTYLLPDGSTITKTQTVPANRRVTVPVAGEDARLVSATPSTRIRSTNGVPIIVERTMWWPAGGPWVEAHNSPGSTSTGTRWAVADGEIGGAPYNTQTFLLIANPGVAAGRVRVTLLFEDGSPVVTRDFDVVAQSRRTIPIFSEFPEASGKGFGALIESIDPGTGTPAPIVVERAMYSDTPERFWGAGTNVLATKLK